MYSAAPPSLLPGLPNARALNTRHKMAKFRTLVSCMRIEINYQAKNLETAICEAIVIYLGYGMPACEIIDQLISRGFIRDPGNNAREDLQGLADIAEQMRRERGNANSLRPAPPLHLLAELQQNATVSLL